MACLGGGREFKAMHHPPIPPDQASPVGLGDDGTEDTHARKEQEGTEDLRVGKCRSDMQWLQWMGGRYSQLCEMNGSSSYVTSALPCEGGRESRRFTLHVTAQEGEGELGRGGCAQEI